ncbi:MAG: hypothetical protein JNL80_09200 [Phycisphaerae bacterium]|nr:hypothetical protein [Phycisphaerae bacterium]
MRAVDDCPQGNFTVPAQPDEWGRTVAMDAAGTHALVGGPGAAGGSGRVRTFANIGGIWSETAMLGPQQGLQGGAEFGNSIAMSADGLTAVIGARGDRHDGKVPFGGSVYVFVREAGSDTWTQQARLIQPSPGVRFLFGTSVAIADDGNTIAVGQVGDTFFGVASDSAWTFTRTGTTWSAASELVPPVRNDAADFGHAVALAGDGSLAAVGAPGQLMVGLGAAMVFRASGANWIHEATLQATPTVAGAGFGRAMAATATQVFVGAPFRNSGEVSVFTKGPREQGGAWLSSQTLRLPTNPPYGSFGTSISVRGEHALVGASSYQSNMGSAFHLHLGNGDWGFEGQFAPPSSDAPPGHAVFYGSSVAISGDGAEFVIGAPLLANGGIANVGKAYFPDLVVEPIVLDLQKNACTMGIGFTLPNGNYIFLTFDVIGHIWATLRKGCEETEDVSSLELTALDLSTVQNEAVIEWGPGETLVFTDLHATLASIGDAVLPDAEGECKLSDYGVTFSANLQVGKGKTIPMSWTTDITVPVEVDSVNGAVRMKVPAASGQVILDLGLGRNNPVANYSAAMLAMEASPPPCPADLDGNGSVEAPDIAILLGEWDVKGSVADLNEDGIVSAPDLAILLGAWGPCPI